MNPSSSFLLGLFLGAALACFVFVLAGILRPDAAKEAPEPGVPWERLPGQPQPGTAAFTILSAMNGKGCLGRCKPDEPVFVLCARDKGAADTVAYWASFVSAMGASVAKVQGARALAGAMLSWREAHGGGKLPD